jgi:uncharacterized protein (TIGR02996 family)
LSAPDSLSDAILDGEREWIASVAADLLDHDRKLVYADWLEDRGDPRSAFLRRYVAALRSMGPGDFPSGEGPSEEWLELIGYRLAKVIADAGLPEKMETYFRLARPALRMVKVEAEDGEVPVGASKISGLPDLPNEVAWPAGKECRAIYNDDTSRVKRLAGFLAQVDLAEIAQTQAARSRRASAISSCRAALGCWHFASAARQSWTRTLWSARARSSFWTAAWAAARRACALRRQPKQFTSPSNLSMKALSWRRAASRLPRASSLWTRASSRSEPLRPSLPAASNWVRASSCLFRAWRRRPSW